ncbi:hypothetical protein WJX73_005034 [Symbiochloris irregularis]|uniref:ParB/Sulfiredoxin domain-containing protein n=1 Tax=Symbiochloris irregularis TaxID=706552 RepID=A0AAW1NJ56_9CHLO
MLQDTRLLESFEGSKQLFKTSVSVAQPLLENAEWQRPVDNARMQLLANFMEAQRYVPNIIYCYEKAAPDGKLYILDGGHRFKAASQLYAARQQDPAFDLPFLLAIRSLRAQENEQEVIQGEMRAINERVQVAGMYIDPSDEQVKQQIQLWTSAVRRKIDDDYTSVVKGSSAPRIPHVNLTKLENELSERLTTMLEESMSSLGPLQITPDNLRESLQHLDAWIDEINRDFERKLAGVQSSSAEKARDKGCFLFAMPPAPLSHFLDAMLAKIQSSAAST